MEDFVISRRQGLKALGAAVGSAVIGTTLITAASATPRFRTSPRLPVAKPSTAVAGTTYTLTVQNESINVFDMCVYQVDPNIGNPNVMSLAWFTQESYPTTKTVFSWQIDYSFVWSQTGVLVPGVTFNASQSWPADPSVVGVSTSKTAGNQIGFSKPSKAYTFTSTATPKAQIGTLYVAEDKTLPLQQASVGIGMGGSGTFAVQAQPNLPLTFTPHPVYYLTAGQYSKGEVLDIGAVTNPVPIEFGPGVFDMTATLNKDNTWTLS
jgi:hypothetical protein